MRRRLAAWPDQVEDLVQESLLAIHNQRQSYDTGLPVTAWIYAIARYKLIDWLRRHARQDSMLQPLDDEDALFSSAEQEAGEARRDVAKLLAELPDKQRDTIVHTKLDGLSVREAAQFSGANWCFRWRWPQPAGLPSAAVYCLHCPELSIVFVGFWYLLGILIPAAVGAAIGPRVLAW